MNYTALQNKQILELLIGNQPVYENEYMPYYTGDGICSLGLIFGRKIDPTKNGIWKSRWDMFRDILIYMEHENRTSEFLAYLFDFARFTALKDRGSKWFYKVFSYLTETKQDASVANFGIYHRKVIDAVLSMGDAMRYFPTQIQWVGFKKAYLPIQHDERAEGKSTYNFSRLFRLAFDTIISFSDKPMRLMVQMGLFVTLIAFVVGIVFIVRYCLGLIEVMGFASLIISLWLLGGIIISLIGVVGIYLGKLFEKAKERPTFIVNDKRNID